MKLVYEKPMMAVERYALTQTIASCSVKIGFQDSECVKKDPDAPNKMKDMAYSNWFVDGFCIITADGMTFENGICYHTSASMTFTS